MKHISKNINTLLRVSHENGYAGFDPLNNEELPFARLNFKFNNKATKVLRKIEKLLILFIPNLGSFYGFFGLKPRINIYGLGVFIQAYIDLVKYDGDKYSGSLAEAEKIFEIAENELSKVTIKKSVPYPVPQNTKISLAGITLKKDTGILIATIEYALGVLEIYKETNDVKYKIRLEELTNSIAFDFKPKNQNASEILNYTTDSDDTNVINVNVLAIDFLSQYSKFFNVTKYDQLIIHLYELILPELENDIISYQLNGDDKQMDVYHTGFTLRGMFNTASYLNREADVMWITNIIEKKYFNWFIDEDSTLVYNLYPSNNFLRKFIDIQGLSEFILMYSQFSYLKIDHELITKSIQHSLDVMYDSKYGLKYRYFFGFRNRIYMPRWSNAVMLRAYANYLRHGKNN